jgi:RNA polymerase sigma factor for flagellar operon FliA
MPALAHNPDFERHQLIRDHLDMARRLARKIARRVPIFVRRDDLESAALLGLTEAANRYDNTRGEPFVAYAAKRVRGAVLDELRKNDILTRRGREGARRLANAANAVEAQVGRAATSQEIADHLGVELAEVQEARARLQPTLVPLDENRDIPKNSAFAPPDEQVANAERKSAVMEALSTLGERDLQILSMYFQDELTLKEIGHIMGVSESRVSQLRSRALGRLRRAIKTE